MTPPAVPPGFDVFDRAAWAARVPGDAVATPPPDTPVSASEWQDIYVPLGAVIGERLERRSSPGPFIIGIAGSVAAGKTTLADALAALLRTRPGSPKVDVISTDSFLLPNAALGARAGFKGFPDTYDHALLATSLTAIASGADEVEIPRYSHEVYDIAGPPFVITKPDIVLLEGVNTLAPETATFRGLSIFVDVDEPDVRAWYVNRFLGLIDAAGDDPSSFFARWTGLPRSAATEVAVAVWQAVNLPNLTEHILGTRWAADIVIHKGADHAVSWVALRRGG